jgi:hypothetical protein
MRKGLKFPLHLAAGKKSLGWEIFSTRFYDYVQSGHQ